MSTVYVETSALLAWVFGETKSDEVHKAIDRAETAVSSVLTPLEADRALIRATTQGIFKEGDRLKAKGALSQMWKGWTIMEITSEIRSRAADPFPVEPLRSLDAIHLATILEFLKVYPELQVLSFDQRILSNLEPLGLSAGV